MLNSNKNYLYVPVCHKITLSKQKSQECSQLRAVWLQASISETSCVLKKQQKKQTLAQGSINKAVQNLLADPDASRCQLPLEEKTTGHS